MQQLTDRLVDMTVVFPQAKQQSGFQFAENKLSLDAKLKYVASLESC